VADTCLGVADTVFLAAVVRAPVATLIEEARHNIATLPIPAGVVDAHLVTAAHGDAEDVYENLDRLRREGTGADRQRKAWQRAGSPAGFVEFLAGATNSVVAAHKEKHVNAEALDRLRVVRGSLSA